MPPRHQTLPQAQTASAREAMASFYCQLCQKGYSRHNEYEAHLSSYDHSHKVRLKEMRAMTRDPTAAARARKAEAKADGVISIQLGGGGGGGGGSAGPAGGGGGAGGGAGGAGFKKGGFKKSGFKSAFAPVGGGGGGGGEEGAAADDRRSRKGGDGAGGGEASARGAALPGASKSSSSPSGGAAESDTEDEGYEVYDPRFPTD